MVSVQTARFRPEAIRELMAREDLNMSGFAARIGVVRQRVQAWLVGQCVPQFTIILTMCAEFGVRPDFFAEGLAVNATRTTQATPATQPRAMRGER